MPYDAHSGCYYADPNGLPGYDEWKTRSPYDEYEPDEPECDHECFEVTWEGRAVCEDCGHEWSATPAEVRAYDAAQRRAQVEWKRENSWYMRAWRWLTKRRQRTVPDDDLPF